MWDGEGGGWFRTASEALCLLADEDSPIEEDEKGVYNGECLDRV